MTKEPVETRGITSTRARARLNGLSATATGGSYHSVAVSELASSAPPPAAADYVGDDLAIPGRDRKRAV